MISHCVNRPPYYVQIGGLAGAIIPPYTVNSSPLETIWPAMPISDMKDGSVWMRLGLPLIPPLLLKQVSHTFDKFMTTSYLQLVCRTAPFLLSRSARRHFSCCSCIVCTRILAATLQSCCCCTSLARPATRKTPTLPLLRLTHLPWPLLLHRHPSLSFVYCACAGTSSFFNLSSANMADISANLYWQFATDIHRVFMFMDWIPWVNRPSYIKNICWMCISWKCIFQKCIFKSECFKNVFSKVYFQKKYSVHSSDLARCISQILLFGFRS